MEQIHAVGGQLVIDRSDLDVARHDDPHASLRQKRPPPRGARPTPAADHEEAGAAQVADAPASSEPKLVGSHLDVLA